MIIKIIDITEIILSKMLSLKIRFIVRFLKLDKKIETPFSILLHEYFLVKMFPLEEKLYIHNGIQKTKE